MPPSTVGLSDLDNWKRVPKEPVIRSPRKRISAPVNRFRASRQKEEEEEAAARGRMKEEVGLPEYRSASRMSVAAQEEGEQKRPSWFERNLV